MRYLFTVDFPTPVDLKYFHASGSTATGRLHLGRVESVVPISGPTPTTHESAMPCGCDPGANHLCEQHASGGIQKV